MLDEQTERNCCIIVRRTIDGTTASHYENANIRDIRSRVRFLSDRNGRAPIHGRFTVSSPNCSDTSFRNPFSIRDNGSMYDEDGVSNLIHRLKNARHINKITVNAIEFVFNRVVERSQVYLSLSNLIGMHAACIPRFWRDVNVGKPIQLGKDEVPFGCWYVSHRR